jgi:hypothetical protein
VKVRGVWCCKQVPTGKSHLTFDHLSVWRSPSSSSAALYYTSISGEEDEEFGRQLYCGSVFTVFKKFCFVFKCFGFGVQCVEQRFTSFLVSLKK